MYSPVLRAVNRELTGEEHPLAVTAALRIPHGGEMPRSEIDGYTEFVKIYGAKRLAYIKVNERAKGRDGLQSPIVKNLHDAALVSIVERTGAQDGDLIFFGADRAKIVADALGALRTRIGHSEFGRKRGLSAPGWKPLWVVDFPMFEFDEEAQRYVAAHHPFTSPKDEHLDLLTTDPGKCLAKAYDMALNGWEIGGGSVRIHRADVQSKVFSALKIGPDEARAKFGFLLDALQYGAPPHGGIAFGLDRIVTMMAGADSIRDVIAFPKTQRAQCLLTQAPSAVDEKQLGELHIRLRGEPQAVAAARARGAWGRVRAGGARRGSGVRGLLRVPLRVAAAALLAVATPGATTATELVYEVTLDPAKPTIAQVRLAAPARERFLATAPVQARGAQIGVAVQAQRLRCDGRGVPLRKDGWHLPRTGCRELTWTIAFDTLGPLGVDASNQQNLYDPARKFWLVSEPASLLRAPGTENGALIEFRGVGEVLGGMARGSGARRTVPGLDAAPEFYFAGGSLPTRRFVAGGRPVVYLKVAEADYAAIERVHRAGLDYLAQVVRATPTTEPSIVVWLPIEESQRATGGAAGSSSILANVATVEGRAQPLRLPFAQLLVLHEQFHQLAPQPLPHWLNESLAEYYARKALRRADPGVGALHLVERRYPPLTAPPRQTLLAVQRQIDDGDFSAYGLLYTEGSNFWLAVDQAILAASEGKRSLDDELPFLLTAEYLQGRLPPAIVERLRAAAGASAFDGLLVGRVGQSP